MMRTIGVVALLAALPLMARADDRSALTACKAVMETAPQAKARTAAGGVNDDAEIARCRIVIREWTLRDSRMLVDEQGRPMR